MTPVAVSPSVVNGLAGIHVAFRLAFRATCYSGVGAVAGGPRTIACVGGGLSNILLICPALYTMVA